MPRLSHLFAVFIAALALGLTGCSALKLPSLSKIPTQKFVATVCATGAVTLSCQSLGTIDVPEGGDTLLSLVVALAGPQLTKQANLKSCLFAVYPANVQGAVTVTGTAACKLNGIPVSENVTVSLQPAKAGSPSGAFVD
jgi:hypothetical protein